MMNSTRSFTILDHKYYDEPTVFLPGNLLREARRQKDIPDCKVPEICVLDPDGDLAIYLTEKVGAVKNRCWACYHSTMYEFELDGTTIGIIPNIVGSSYAVLVAEQLFSSGCELLISITSAGIIGSTNSKRFALITEAVRDEGTSYHYLPPDRPSVIQGTLLDKLSALTKSAECPWFMAKSWTTDAPYRETRQAIESMKDAGVCCVEMECAALYAYATARDKNIICFAHLTNTMAQEVGDFEKGEHFGSIDSLNLLKILLGWKM